MLSSRIQWDRRTFPKIIKGSNGIQDSLVNFTIGSDEIIHPILHFHERSPRIKDPAVGSINISAWKSCDWLMFKIVESDCLMTCVIRFIVMIKLVITKE